MAELASSQSILFGKGKFEPITDGVSGVHVFQNENIFKFGQREISDSLKHLSDETRTLRLKANNGGQQPKDVWAGIVGGVRSFMSGTDAVLGTEVPYESADHKLGIAFSKNVDVLTPSHIGPERKAHLERCGQRITDIIHRAKLVQLAEGYMAAGKPLDEQWLRDTFNTTLPSGLRDILREYGDSLKSVMGEAYENVAFGKLPETKAQASSETRSRITVDRGTPAILQETTAAHVFTVPSMFQAVTAENALTALHLTTMDKVNISAGVVLVGFGSLTACAPAGPVMPTETLQIPSANITPEKPNSTTIPTTKPTTEPTTQQKPETTPTNPVAVGPEATPGASVPYPTELSAEVIKGLIAATEPKIPISIAKDAGVLAIVEKHTGWAKTAGLDFDTMQIHMAPDGAHWYLVPEKNGSVAGWLMIEDPSSQTGWRYAEQPTWDSKFDPLKDKFKFGLPSLRNGADHWDVVHAGFPILTEVAANGEPQYWNSAVSKTMEEAKGAAIVEDLGPIHEKVQADPWTATDAEKAKSDEYIINNLHTMLKEAGVPNAESLQGYELLDALITYQQNLITKGGLTNPSDYLIELPISLHELIRTDLNNVVVNHYDESRALRYGVGGTSGITKDDLLTNVIGLFPDFSVYGKTLHLNANPFGISGDLMLLYKTPGVDPSVGFGAVVGMYDGDKVAYTEIFIPTSTAPINSGDVCVNRAVGEVIEPIACPVGTQRNQGALRAEAEKINWKPIELADIIKIMSKNKQTYVEIIGAGTASSVIPEWSDGALIIDNIKVIEQK